MGVQTPSRQRNRQRIGGEGREAKNGLPYRNSSGDPSGDPSGDLSGDPSGEQACLQGLSFFKVMAPKRAKPP